MNKRDDGRTFKKRLGLIRSQLSDSGSALINRWPGGSKEKKAAARFFNNPKVKLENLISMSHNACEKNCPAGHVLVLQDTTELNYNSHNGLLRVLDPDIGVISDNKSTGILLHPALALAAESGYPFGVSSMELGQRAFDRPKKTDEVQKALPIEEKESYKWIQAALESKKCLSSADQLTIIGDRENDLYEYFCLIPDAKTHLLVRSSYDRKLANALKLGQHLENCAWTDRLELEIKGNEHRRARKAQLQIRWSEISLIKPKNRKQFLAAYPDEVSLYVVELKEDSATVPLGEEPVHWRLYTTHEVETLADALQIAQWYQQRWWIEDFFRIIKTQGLEVESTQLGTGIARKKLLVLCLEEARKILLMRQERNGAAGLKVEVFFSQEEQQCLKMIQPLVEGKGSKQKNPHPEASLAWAVWMIARLGGWDARDLRKRPPGVISLARGLIHFNQRFRGWKMALQFMRDNHKYQT